MVKRPSDWRWSSYRAHAGLTPAPKWLDSGALHRRLAPRAAQREGPDRYAQFVLAGRGMRLWEEALTGQIYLGDERFVRRMQARAGSLDDREIPKAQRRPKARALQWYLTQYDRNTAIAIAYLEGGHTQSAIATATGLSVSRVSRLISTHEAKGKT